MALSESLSIAAIIIAAISLAVSIATLVFQRIDHNRRGQHLGFSFDCSRTRNTLTIHNLTAEPATILDLRLYASLPPRGPRGEKEHLAPMPRRRGMSFRRYWSILGPWLADVVAGATEGDAANQWPWVVPQDHLDEETGLASRIAVSIAGFTPACTLPPFSAIECVWIWPDELFPQRTGWKRFLDFRTFSILIILGTGRRIIRPALSYKTGLTSILGWLGSRG